MTPTLIARAAATATPSAPAACITVEPLKNGYVPGWACNAVYNYSPSLASAVAYSTLFGLVFLAHVIQSTAYKKWRLGWVVAVGASWELLSAACYAVGSQQQQNQGLAGSAMMFGLLAPLWINAAVYMILARMIYFYLPDKRVWGLNATRLSLIFVLSDIVSFIVQAAGGLMTTPGNSADTVERGLHLYMGGIGLQQASILIFVGFATQFCRLKKLYDPDGLKRWRGLISAVFFSLAMITIRIVYRMVEYAKGLDPDKNRLPFHQIYASLLDALPMFLALTSLAVFHSGRYLRGVNSEFPSTGSRWLCCLCKKKKHTTETSITDAASTPSSEAKMPFEQA